MISSLSHASRNLPLIFFFGGGVATVTNITVYLTHLRVRIHFEGANPCDRQYQTRQRNHFRHLLLTFACPHILSPL